MNSKEVLRHLADMFTSLHKSLQLHDVRIHGLNQQIEKLREIADSAVIDEEEEVKEEDNKNIKSKKSSKSDDKETELVKS